MNPYIGWIVNLVGEIYKTTYGGNNWQLPYSDTANWCRSVGFADSLRGWTRFLVPNDQNGSVMYQTFDGGENWSPVNNFSDPQPKGFCGISVVNDSVVYAVGTIANIHRWKKQLIKEIHGHQLILVIILRMLLIFIFIPRIQVSL